MFDILLMCCRGLNCYLAILANRSISVQYSSQLFAYVVISPLLCTSLTREFSVAQLELDTTVKNSNQIIIQITLKTPMSKYYENLSTMNKIYLG